MTFVEIQKKMIEITKESFDREAFNCLFGLPDEDDEEEEDSPI